MSPLSNYLDLEFSPFSWEHVLKFTSTIHLCGEGRVEAANGY